jgi:glucan biosynthesis protein
MTADTVIRGVVSTMGGGDGMAVLEQQVAKIPATSGWRLVFKVPKPDGAALELRGFLELGGKTLTETWTYTLEP